MKEEEIIREFQALCDCLLVECGALGRLWKEQAPEGGAPKPLLRLMNRVLDLRLKVKNPDCAAAIDEMRKRAEEAAA